MGRQFTIEWPDFKAKVTAELSDETNREYCDVFWNRLPFKTIFAASMSAGEMFKIPTPFMLPPTPPDKNVFFPKVEPGTIVGMQWGSIMMKYGICAEPFQLPLLARVITSDIPILRDVAVKLRDAYFFTKEINIANFSKKE